jgi:Tfp pilus assembly protein PilN
MIKINLRTSAVSADGVIGSAGSGSDDQIQKRAITNIVFFIVGPILLYIYATQAKPKMVGRMVSLNQQIEELRVFNQKEANIVAEISKIKEDENNVQMRIDALKKITLGRLAEIKALDLMQSYLRDRMWFTAIDMIEGEIKIEGIAQSEIDVNQFQDEMTRNILFKNVFLEKTSTELIEGQPFSRFVIKASLEKSK